MNTNELSKEIKGDSITECLIKIQKEISENKKLKNKKRTHSMDENEDLSKKINQNKQSRYILNGIVEDDVDQLISLMHAENKNKSERNKPINSTIKSTIVLKQTEIEIKKNIRD